MTSDRFRFADGKTLSYVDMLQEVQQVISRERPSAASDVKSLPQIVERYLINRRVEANRPFAAIAVDMAEDMAGKSAVLARYLDHLDQYPTLEEINGNAWNSIWLRFTDRPDQRLDETFLSPRHAKNILNKLLSRSASPLLNQSTPGVVSYIIGLEGVRDTAICEPIVPSDAGVCFSIRIVRPNVVTGKNILSENELSPDMLELLALCVKYRVSVAISGEKGAGKTSLLNYLLSLIPAGRRVGLIEEGGRELSLRRFDAQGRQSNQVLSMLTRPSDKPEENFDASRLLELCLRFDLEYLVPQEMRSGEAYAAQEAARTGTAVYTTLHCNDAAGTYPRIVSLCQKQSSELSSVLMGYAVEAFPISLHMRKMGDDRRCIEIVEADGVEHGKVLSHPLFRYVVEDNVRGEDGRIHSKGHFEQVGRLTARLRDRMLYHLASRLELEKFL